MNEGGNGPSENTTLTIYVPVVLKAWLKAQARLEGRSTSALVCRCLAAFQKQIESKSMEV